VITVPHIARELVLTSAARTEGLAVWLRDVEARAARVDPGDTTFLVVTPLGFAQRERLLARLEAGRVEVRCRTVVPSWPRVASAIRLVGAPSARLRRAARFEAVWESLFPATPAEAWALAPGAHVRAAAMKRALRKEFPGVDVDLGDGWRAPSWLFAFHLPDILDARDEARRLIAALALVSERAWQPRRRFADLAPGLSAKDATRSRSTRAGRA
jgi:hypothetical protein